MAKIFIKGLYTLLGKIIASEKLCSFQVSISDKHVLHIDVNTENEKDNEVKVWGEVEVSAGLLRAMEAEKYKGLSEKLEAELSGLTRNVGLAARKVLNLIKYCFNQYEIDEELMSSRGIFWSKDGRKWNRISSRLRVTTSVTGILGLNKDSCKWLQDYIDSGYQPLLALRHLHRARKEHGSRHKWIEATIAAELAIKEFLIRLKPELATLLLEVPSPPMHKMYGVILKEYTDKKLDKEVFKALVEGAEIRNRLLHRPEREKIDDQKANNYISAVSEAMRQLLSILYPRREHHLVV